jgi:hypothetical protein
MADNHGGFDEFYQFYLTEHSKRSTKILHFAGTFLVFVVFGVALLRQNWMLLILLPVVGYGFAWVGHFFFEKNRPASFSSPLYSLLSDFVMFRDILTGRVKI